mmetsp:Transcript_79629/g.131709  ORF Transcript_79629/g.131709 Transcript_79629/m.131709 type:complete len:356 (-) Transcript_79629:102-1169(-)
MRKRPHPASASADPAAAKAPTLGVGGAMPLPTMSTSRTVAALVAGGGEGAERLAAQIMPPSVAGLLGRPTVLCKFFLRGGKCQKGAACTFSHDIQGMPTVPVDQKLKTPCRYFELGQCMRGPACKFAHGYEELEAISAQLKASKKGRTGGEFGPEPLAPEAAAAADATAALASASGFQNFDDFDPNAAGATDLQAKVDAQTPLPPDIDDAWTSFLSQVADGDGEKVGEKSEAALEKDAPEDAASRGGESVVDGQALRAELGWDKPLPLPPREATNNVVGQDLTGPKPVGLQMLEELQATGTVAAGIIGAPRGIIEAPIAGGGFAAVAAATAVGGERLQEQVSTAAFFNFQLDRFT